MLKFRLYAETKIRNKVASVFSKYLPIYTDDEQISAIRYELWRLTGDDTHRVKAVEMYRAEYEKTPNYEFKQRMEEMS